MSKVRPASCAAALGLLLLTAGGCEPGHPQPTATETAAPTSPGAGLKAAGFDATVFEVALSTDKAASLDLKALTAEAGSSQSLLDALRKVGEAKVVYQASQPVSLTAASQVHVGARKPFVSTSRRVGKGSTVNTVQYENVGAIFKLSVDPNESVGDVLEVRLEAEISTSGEGGVEIAPGRKAVVMRTAQFHYEGQVQIGRPVLVMALDSGSAAKKGESIAYVCRILLSKLP